MILTLSVVLSEDALKSPQGQEMSVVKSKVLKFPERERERRLSFTVTFPLQYSAKLIELKWN